MERLNSPLHLMRECFNSANRMPEKKLKQS